MPTRKEIGVLVALGLIVTVVVFPLGFFASRALWPTSSQSAEADPLGELNAKYKGLFKTRTEIFKMNWCLANPTRCPNGTFPTEGHEAELVRNYSKDYDADQNKTDEWYRCTTFRTLFAEKKGDNDRCCQTHLSWHVMSGFKNTVKEVSCYLPSYKNTYQKISIGDCYGSNRGCIQVNGKCCKLKQRPVYLFCVPRGSSPDNLEYAMFHVDTYCSCQNICI